MTALYVPPSSTFSNQSVLASVTEACAVQNTPFPDREMNNKERSVCLFAPCCLSSSFIWHMLSASELATDWGWLQHFTSLFEKLEIFFLTELTKSIFGESVFTHDKITAALFELRQISVLLGCNLWTHLSVVYLSFLSFKRSFFYIYIQSKIWFYEFL